MAKQFEEQLQEEINSEFLFEAFRDTQNKLNIITKNTNTTLPRFITVSRLPSPELFMPSLEEELAQKDITDEERQAQAEAERKAQEEAEAKAKAEEEARLEAERLAKEEEERKAREEEEARLKAEEEAKAKAEEEARLEAERQEQERLEAEKKAQEEAEAQPNVDETEEQPELEEPPVEETTEEPVVEEQPTEETSIEEPQVEEQEVEQEEPVVEEVKEEPAPQPIQEEKPKKKLPPQQEHISVISFATLKGKKKPIAKMSTMQAGGIAAAKMEHDKQKEELIAIRKEEAAARAEQRKIEREKEALERLPNAILIGNTKAPSPELGKFEIASSKDADKPFRLLLRTEKGQVVFETSPMKTKPNELTAVMFKDIMNTGSFTFTRSINGFAFQILDSRKRVFYSSRSFINLNDAKRAAAMIKKYGLSANYIDDTTI